MHIDFLACMSQGKKSKFEMAVIDRVTAMRHRKGLSQEYIAAVLGFSKGFIGQVESPNHPSKYNLDHLNRLAYEMGCSPKDFLPEESVIDPGWEDN
jgi:transcriptional regulator with XRE-family HTH domain